MSLPAIGTVGSFFHPRSFGVMLLGTVVGYTACGRRVIVEFVIDGKRHRTGPEYI